MPIEYRDMQYRDLQKLCKERELNAKGNRDTLIDRLVNADLGHDPEPTPKPDPIPESKKPLKATDPNPENPNWDMAGRWIRR